MLTGSVIGSLLIRITELNLSGYEEPVEATVVNIASMSLLMIPFTAYLASQTKWSNWKMDLVFGGGAGVLLGTAQGLASPGAPVIGVIIHCLALALSLPLVLIGIRALKNMTLPSALIRSVPITAAMTLVISLVDYGYFL
jgi:hypothetical protein